MRRRSALLLFALLVAALGLSQLIAQDPSIPSGWREVPAQWRRGAWAAFSSTNPPDATPAATPGVAHVRHLPGTRLVEQVPPGEGAVDVVRQVETPFGSGLGDEAQLEAESFVRLAEAVAVVEVREVQASLTVAEDSIESTVSLTVKEVLKSGEGLAALTEGQELRIKAEGGTLLVAGREVTVRRNGETLPRTGGTYIYFFGLTPVTFVPPDTFIQEPELVPFLPLHNFEIRGDQLHRMWRHPGVRGALDTVSAEAALEMIRSAAREQRR